MRPVVTEVALRGRHEVGDWAERILAMAAPGDEESVVSGLACAAQRYKLSQDANGYERLGVTLR